MGKMSELYLEIEELLYQGHNAQTVAKLSSVPLEFVYDVEDNLKAALDPRNYGPDYDETY